MENGSPLQWELRGFAFAAMLLAASSINIVYTFKLAMERFNSNNMQSVSRVFRKSKANRLALSWLGKQEAQECCKVSIGIETMPLDGT